MSNLYKEIYGDVLNPVVDPQYGKLVVIPHICNNSGKFGAGFAKSLADKFPIARDRYMEYWRHIPLGDCQFVEIKSLLPTDVYVVNMIAQSGVRGPDNPTPIKYEALVECMARVREFIFKKEGQGAPTSSIHCPKFGSGLAGGNWPFIKALIEEMWSGNCIPVTVYEYELRRI